MFRSFRNTILTVTVAILAFAMQATAQDVYPQGATPETHRSDTTQKNELTEADLNRIADMKALLRKRNASYSRPVTLSEHLLDLIARYIPEEISYLSDEAIEIINPQTPYRLFPRYITFRDTVIANPIFLPIVFQTKKAPDKLKFTATRKSLKEYKYNLYKPTVSIFEKETRQKAYADNLYKFIEKNHPNLIRYTDKDVPKVKVVLRSITTPVYEDVPLPVVRTAKVEDTEAPPKFIPDRLYWTSAFESSAQFAQNYISPNWYKGGSSNINIYTRNYLKYDYNKNSIQFTNEAELKANIYNAPNDTLHYYKIGDDILRLHSALGVKAFSKWYYTLDAEFRTQMFTNYQENTETKQAALLAPFSFNMGLGMKYDMEKTFKERGRKLTLRANLAPASFTYMKSVQDDIDLGRHGFKKKKDESGEFNNELTRLGSTVRVDMTMSFNRSVSLTSRLYYFTNYEITQYEFENTLTFAISRYFSTVVYAHLRYDDSVTKKPDYDSYFQLNERLSLGFNYKW
jgi:hypothetical protein